VVGPLTPPLSDARSCDDCGLCCKLMGVTALDKPAGRWCTHFKKAQGCRIYNDRPTDCRIFNCLWLLTDALDADWKPSVCGFVLHSEAGGARLIVECDAARPHDWRRAPYQATLTAWASQGQEVLIMTGRTGLRLLPDGETRPVRRAG